MIFLLAPFSNKAGITECIAAIKDAFNRCLDTEHHIVIIKGKELISKNKKTPRATIMCLK